MPRKYRRRSARITYSTAEVREAAQAIVPVAEGVVQRLVERCAEIAKGQTAAPRRPRGRGSQLRPTEQIAIMAFAQFLTDRPREIAAYLGYHPRTVARILASKKYQKVDQIVAAQALVNMGGVRGFMRMLR